MTAKPQNSAIPTAPTWMSPAAKRLFSSLVAIEMRWKRSISCAEAALLADYCDLRVRADGLRKIMRSELRKRDDVARLLAVSKEINATVGAAQRLAEKLELARREQGIT